MSEEQTETMKMVRALSERNQQLEKDLHQAATYGQKLIARVDEMGAVILALIVDKVKSETVTFKLKRLNKLIRQYKLERQSDELRVTIKVTELPKSQQLPMEDEPANDDQDPVAEPPATPPVPDQNAGGA